MSKNKPQAKVFANKPLQDPGTGLSLIMEMAGTTNISVLALPVDMIVADEQVRKEFVDIEELGSTMRDEGQQTPITVSPQDPVTGKYTIQKGERRWRAAKAAGLATVQAMIAEKPENKVDSIVGQLIENIQRDDLKPMETALALAMLHAEGLSYSAIGKRIGKSKQYVSSYMTLHTAPEYIQELCVQHITADMDIVRTLCSIHKLDESASKELCRAALDGEGISRKGCRDALDQLRAGDSNETGPAAQAQGSTKSSAPNKEALTSEDPVAPGGAAPPEEGSSADSQYEIDPETGEAQSLMTFESEGRDEGGSDDSAGQAKPARLEQSVPSASDAGAPEEWTELDTADALTIEVDVIIDGDQSAGYLMTNRVSPAPSFAWVYLHDGYSLCTHVTNIAITGVKLK